MLVTCIFLNANLTLGAKLTILLFYLCWNIWLLYDMFVVHLSKRRQLSLGVHRYDLYTVISLKMVWNGSQWNQCWGAGSFKLGTGAFCLKVVKYFEILTYFCSLSISFFLLVCLCPVSLAFPHSWPQGRCDSWEQNEEESIQGFWNTRAKALRDLGRTAGLSNESARILVEGASPPGN